MMRRPILLALLVLALTARPAGAVGDFLISWGDCAGSGTETGTVLNTCASNSGRLALFGSVLPAAPLPAVVGLTAVVDLFDPNDAGKPLSAWWQLGTGGCRDGALSANFDFTTGAGICMDPWNGAATGSVSFVTPSPNACMAGYGSARLTVTCSVPDAKAAPMDPIYVYYGFEILINKTGSVPPGNCADCLDEVILIPQSLQLTQTAGTGDPPPLLGSGVAYVNWDSFSGCGPPTVCGIDLGLCPDPAARKTWGAIKAIYR